MEKASKRLDDIMHNLCNLSAVWDGGKPSPSLEKQGTSTLGRTRKTFLRDLQEKNISPEYDTLSSTRLKVCKRLPLGFVLFFTRL
jgi:hypothetical protein